MPTVNYIVHDAAGVIRRSGICHDSDLDAQAWDTGEVAVESSGETDATHYMTGSPLEAALRPASSMSIDTTTIDSGASPEEVATISNIPNPSTVWVTDSNGRSTYEETSGSFEIVSDAADIITVEIQSDFPELPFKATITAT
jgi:hypothetical protein